MNRTIARLLGTMMALFLVAYSGYQAHRYFNTPYATETALNYSTQDFARVKGVIIRDEQSINERAEGVTSYLYADGTKVTPATTIAEIYQSADDLALQRRIRDLTSELNMLTSVPEQQVAEFSNAEALSRQIRQLSDEIMTLSGSGVVGNLGDKKLQLTSLILRKQLATGRSRGFDTQVKLLESEITALSARMKQPYTVLKSPLEGYFVQITDGLEAELSPEAAAGFTVAEFEAYADARVVQSDALLGKIIKSHNWYYAAIVPQGELYKFKVGDKITLNFNLFNLNDIPFIIEEIRQDATGESAVALLKSSYILPELVAVRNPTADIVFRTYSGLKIPASAIRYEQGVKGGYIIENNTVRFKTIQTIYETDEYVLCGGNPDTERPLLQYHQVIVEGTDLRDGKPVNT